MTLSQRISITLSLLAGLLTSGLYAQDINIRGTVYDPSGKGIINANVYCLQTYSGTTTDQEGAFILEIKKPVSPFLLVISCVGYITDTITIGDQGSKSINIVLEHDIVKIGEVSIKANRHDQINTFLLPVSVSVVIPSVASGIESMIQTLPGVSSFSELSYQYSVRGGSYDENLVYINNIEVYRPYLVRSGQQEGLSQINPDLVSSVSFSPGGFNTTYGDRMSSVLDIKYRQPSEKKSSVSLSLLTSSAHTEAVSHDGKVWLLAGIRYRNNSLLLGSLDNKGQYRPRFSDLQAMAGYKINEDSQITLIIRGSSNRYEFIPQSQTTTFGSVSSAYKLYAYFEGGERDHYSNLSGAVTFENESDKIATRLILSSHLGMENENFDIRGAYSLSSLDKTEGSETIPDSLLNIGIGGWLDHARNRLFTGITALSYHGSYKHGIHSLEWGLTGKLREYDIFVNEWLRIDSAGYTLGAGESLTLTEYEETENHMSSVGGELFISNIAKLSIAGRKGQLSTGIRASADSYNNELLVSPRASLKVFLLPSLSVHLSLGAYHQPPGGKEIMRSMENVTTPLKAQRSYHISAGAELDFPAWDRPFRFTAELYGKKLDNIIPYRVDNVRIIYYGGNIAEGYTTGLDMRVNGEFVEGVESWFSLSLMKSEMKISDNDSRWFPAPFDQRLNVDIFFQDYLPDHPDFRAHINIVFGTGTPTSPPGREQWEQWFRMPPYRRIDIGFSKVFIGEVKGKIIGRPTSVIKELIAGVEIFNLADIHNTISYTWIRSVQNSEGNTIEYAVPNYLTSRCLNFRVRASF